MDNNSQKFKAALEPLVEAFGPHPSKVEGDKISVRIRLKDSEAETREAFVVGALKNLREAGFNHVIDEDLSTNENGLNYADKAVWMDFWIKFDAEKGMFKA